MATRANTPKHDSGKLKNIEVPTERVNHSAYFAELDAIDAMARELDAEHHSESVWDRWEERSIRVCSEIEALPATPGNAYIKSQAVWSIISGDIDDLNEGKSRSDRLVRQIVTSLVRTVASNRTQWDAALAGLKWAQDAHLAAIDAHSEAETRYYARRPGTSQSELEALIAKSQSDDARTSEESSAAADAVLACPAPDLAAVARKIEIAQEYGRAALELGSVIADIRRLSGEA